jgi:hypothetical protein
MGVKKERRPVLTPGVQLDTSFVDGTFEGRLQWNEQDGTMEYGIKGGTVVLQVGQEMVTRVVNKTGSVLPNGTIVYVSGAQGNRPKVAPARADSIITTGAQGMCTEEIANNAQGYVCTSGMVHELNTQGIAEGSLLYLSPTVAGAWTTTRPTAPHYKVFIGYVTKEHVTDGHIVVNPIIVPRLLSLSDVLEGVPNDGDTIRWSAANSRFELGP